MCVHAYVSQCHMNKDLQFKHFYSTHPCMFTYFITFNDLYVLSTNQIGLADVGSVL